MPLRKPRHIVEQMSSSLVEPRILPHRKGLLLFPVVSAEEMYETVIQRYEEMDLVVKAAAVADYRPKVVYDQKMKKKPGDLVIELERTRDILLELGQRKQNQFLVGFAAETENLEENARSKMERKNADMIVANNVARPGAGFGTDTNIVTIFRKDGETRSLPQLEKKEVANEILNFVVETWKA